MATTTADLNCADHGALELYPEKVQELTSVLVSCLPCLHRIARRRIGNTADAEDVVQDALVSAYTHVHQFRGQARMSTWLTSIILNSASRTLRRQSRQLRREARDEDFHQFAEIISDSRPSPEEECRRAERAELLAQSVTRLSPTLRRTFQLRDVDGLSIRDTATLLGVPDGTVKARLARARTKLKQHLQGSWP
jgi:RNA polymerase sigma-70 factor, ECF subfamily